MAQRRPTPVCMLGPMPPRAACLLVSFQPGRARHCPFGDLHAQLSVGMMEWHTRMHKHGTVH